MERLTNAEVRVDSSVDGMIGPLVDLTNLKPKLLNMILNGPTLNGVSKDTLRQVIRQLYSELAAYEDTRLTPERCAEFARADAEGRYIVMRDAKQEGVARLRELAEADKDGRVVVLPCKVGDTVYMTFGKRVEERRVIEFDVVACKSSGPVVHAALAADQQATMSVRWDLVVDKTVFLTRKDAEAALKGEENGRG